MWRNRKQTSENRIDSPLINVVAVADLREQALIIQKITDTIYASAELGDTVKTIDSCKIAENRLLEPTLQHRRICNHIVTNMLRYSVRSMRASSPAISQNSIIFLAFCKSSLDSLMFTMTHTIK